MFPEDPDISDVFWLLESSEADAAKPARGQSASANGSTTAVANLPVHEEVEVIDSIPQGGRSIYAIAGWGKAEVARPQEAMICQGESESWNPMSLLAIPDVNLIPASST